MKEQCWLVRKIKQAPAGGNKNNKMHKVSLFWKERARLKKGKIPAIVYGLEKQLTLRRKKGPPNRFYLNGHTSRFRPPTDQFLSIIYNSWRKEIPKKNKRKGKDTLSTWNSGSTVKAFFTVNEHSTKAQTEPLYGAPGEYKLEWFERKCVKYGGGTHLKCVAAKFHTVIFYDARNTLQHHASSFSICRLWDLIFFCKKIDVAVSED